MAASFLREFLTSSDWEQMQDLLEETVGASILWVISGSGRSAQRYDERYSKLCQLIRGSAEGLRRCRNSHHARSQEVRRTGQPAISACYCGLIAFALPLILDNEIIGVAGGCHNRAESPITMEKCAEISVACDIDVKEITDLAKKIKHMPKVEQKRFLNALSLFAGTTSLVMKWANRLFLSLNLEGQYAAKLSSLGEIGNLAASELDWEGMLGTITSKTKALLDANACSIYVLDQSRQELVLSATDGLPVAVVGRRIKVGDGIIGHVAQTRLAIAVEDVTLDPRVKSFSVPATTGTSRTGGRRRSFRSILAVPLVAQDRLVGVIDVRTYDPKAWAQTDIHFLSIIAAQVAGIIEKDKFRMEFSRELEAARYIQERLLPESLPEIKGYDLAALIIPNSQVGGDYYDFISRADERLGIIVADVSGKGIGGAMLMANTQGLVNAHTQRKGRTKDAISNINNALYESTEPEKFVTMFYGVLNTKTGFLSYTNAGHNYPFIYRAGNEKPRALDKGGTVLGAVKDTDYAEGRAKLVSGDILVLYSDGVTEARNEEDELFGEERLHKLVYEYMEENAGSLSAQKLLNQIYDAVRQFASNMLLTDDLTIVVLCST